MIQPLPAFAQNVRAYATHSPPPQPGQGARMPFSVELGPYRLAVELLPSRQMLDRRRRACINLERHRIELRQDLGGLRLAEAFLDCLIRLSHFSKGCQQGCVEEAYAHSLATGLVEFALRNPRAWLWFNLLLGEHLPGRPRYDRAVRGALPRPPAMPRRLLVGSHTVAVRSLSRSECGNAFGWYDYDRREVQLLEGLSGPNLPVVAVHEITHAVHHAYALRTRDTHRNFARCQLEGWMGIMRDNPSGWRWLAWVMHTQAMA
jgi:hypothetical protein